MSRSSEGGCGRRVAGGGDGPRVWRDRPVYLDATAHTRSNCKSDDQVARFKYINDDSVELFTNQSIQVCQSYT